MKVNPQRVIFTLVAATILASLLLVSPTLPQAGKKVVVDMKTGRPLGSLYLTEFVGNLTDRGFVVVVAHGGINSTILADADALILPKIRDGSGNYTQAEIDAIVAWMRTGNKFLWVGTDSDYLSSYLATTGSDLVEDQPNKVLAAIGSHIRFDLCSVESPTWNIGAAPYRTLSNITNTADPDAAKILTGITNPVMFHGPAAIYFVTDQGTAVAYESLPKPGLFSSKPAVFWVFKSSPDSKIVDGSPMHPPVFFQAGEIGSTVEMAGEKYIFGSSKVIATVESVVGDYAIWYPFYRGVALDGWKAILNTIEWGVTAESEPIPTGYYIVGGVVVIVVVAGAYFFFIKKK